jgi:hypothetical protein
MRYTVTPFIDETYPDEVVFLALHLNDAGAIPWNSPRWGSYNEQYIPNTFFGCDPDNYVGYPGPTAPQWVNRVEDQLAIPTDVTIDLFTDGSAQPDFSTTAVVCLEEGGTPKDVRVFVGYTIDDYPSSSQYRYRNTLYGMGAHEDISLVPGECIPVMRDFTLNSIAQSRRDTVQAVAWAQTPFAGVGESYQAAKLRFVELFDEGFDATGDLSGWTEVLQ